MSRSQTSDRLVTEMVFLSTLLFAGTDTSSGTLGRILELLATHQDAQDKLREEFEAARDYPGQDLSYDKLNDLHYLDAICRETLRLYVFFQLLLYSACLTHELTGIVRSTCSHASMCLLKNRIRALDI